ncbi:MAG: TonB-dependent receptor plug domain-containing protein [Bacteroidota bacterium]
MRIAVLFLLLFSLVFTGCSTAKQGETTVDLQNKAAVKSSNETDVDAATGIDLASYLRRLPGVTVRGSGSNASVRVRTQSSFGAVSDPLFVVNGTILGTSFSQLFTAIDVNEIKSVRVLKSASETASYGLQGGNGVLEFKLK